MEIKLLIDNKEKSFVVPFIKARMFRRALEINKQVDFSNLNEESLDKLIDFVVETFNGQFTRDEFYDGIGADKLVDSIIKVIEEVVGATSKTDGDSQAGN